jgi:magnesium chelatase family protein
MEVFSRSGSSLAIQARKEKFTGFIVPYPNSREAAMVNQLAVYPETHIRELVEFLDNKIPIKPLPPDTGLDFFLNQYQFDLISGMCADNIISKERLKLQLPVAIMPP